MPATLILHGARDTLVPVSKAHALAKALKEAMVPFEIKIYPDQGHGFSAEVARKAMELGFRFLDKHLAPRKPKGS